MPFEPLIQAMEEGNEIFQGTGRMFPEARFYTQAPGVQLEHIVQACGFFKVEFKGGPLTIYEHESGCINGTVTSFDPRFREALQRQLRVYGIDDMYGETLDSQFDELELALKNVRTDDQYRCNSLFHYRREGQKRKGVAEAMGRVTKEIMQQLNRKKIPAYWKLEFGGPLIIVNNFDEISH